MEGLGLGATREPLGQRQRDEPGIKLVTLSELKAAITLVLENFSCVAPESAHGLVDRHLGADVWRQLSR